PTLTSSLSLHDALPIYLSRYGRPFCRRSSLHNGVAPRLRTIPATRVEQLAPTVVPRAQRRPAAAQLQVRALREGSRPLRLGRRIDRKSTRLNSSHQIIS